MVNPYSVKNESLAAFVKFTGQKNYDENAALIQLYGWAAASGWIIADILTYTKPVVNPPVFQELLDIQPQYVNTMRISNMSDFALEVAAGPVNRQQVFFTSTWSNDLRTLSDIVALNEQYLQKVIGVDGLTWVLGLQPLVTAITTKSAATGGNALGLDGSDGNLVRKSPIPSQYLRSVPRTLTKYQLTLSSRSHYSQLEQRHRQCCRYRSRLWILCSCG